jgi:hypothetical protein
MLFILAMDVLRFLISKAESVGLLKPLPTRTLQHRVSFYADDVVLSFTQQQGTLILPWTSFRYLGKHQDCVTT